jgi:hypothetical protein
MQNSRLHPMAPPMVVAIDSERRNGLLPGDVHLAAALSSNTGF